MVSESVKPNIILNDLFKEYYYIQINSIQQKPVIDDCSYDIIFYKEVNSVLIHGEELTETLIPYKLFTIHQVPPPCSIRISGSLTFFSIKLQPWANATLFSYLKKPGIADISEKYAKLFSFHKSLMKEQSLTSRFSLADDILKDFSTELSSSVIFVKKICKYIYDAKGLISVNELSEKFKKSRQYINRTFKKEVLYSLKKFIITVRIIDLIKFKSKNEEISLTKLAYQYNYFDQSHFNRDFKKVCGVTPNEFFNELPEFYLRH